MMSLPTVLVFPINMAQSVAFSRTARDIGLKVVAATSEIITLAQRAEGVFHLPYITELEFDKAFANLLINEGVTLVYSPHPAIWRHVGALRERKDFPVTFRLCNESPLDADWHPYARAYDWADSCMATLPLFSGSPAHPLSRQRYASLHRSYSEIPGQSDDDKIWLLTQIARYTPPGDVVEIGSAYGRSAFALAWLAKFHAIGTVICVDPWDSVSSADQGSEAVLISEAVKDVNWENIFSVFCASISGFDNAGYIRKPSQAAVKEYKEAALEGTMTTAGIGTVKVSGKISILHIDGNHKYEEVKQDILNWRPLMSEGGWLLVDDYQWAFGDGPKRAGDEILDKSLVKTSFVVGDTLCIQI